MKKGDDRGIWMRWSARYKVQGTRYEVQGTRDKRQGTRDKRQGTRDKGHGKKGSGDREIATVIPIALPELIPSS